MLEQKMSVALNQQANAELCAGYLYLSMSYDMDNRGKL
jgi:ferritin